MGSTLKEIEKRKDRPKHFSAQHMVMREAMVLALASLSAGAVLALALANLIRNQLFGLNPHDPWTLLGASFSLALAAGLAGFIPAVRASSVDPTQALRQD